MQDRDNRILRNRLLAAALVAISFLVLLAHARQLYFGPSYNASACCASLDAPAAQPGPAPARLPSRSETLLSRPHFDLTSPYELTPEELREVGPIPPDEWIILQGR